MRKEKFKSENNNDKSYTHTHKKYVASEINQMKRVLHKHINMKKSAVSVVQERIC